METINIEGQTYKVQGDIFTTPDGKYDIFKVDDRWNYVRVKEYADELSSSSAVKFYERSWLVLMAVVVIILTTVLYFAFA